MKTIRSINEKDLHEKIIEMRGELAKLRIEAAKGARRSDVGRIKVTRRDIARLLTRENELK